jgi:DNA-binding GntR family transcriptional regulator
VDIQDAQSVTSLRDMVLRRVRADIVSGHSAPGTMYSVPTLAEELGVSTTPVREALLELSLHGLITPVRNRGFRVEATSPDDLRDLFELRVLLERYAMECVARKRISDTEDLKKLADNVATAVKRKDGRGYIDTDRAFHLALVTRAGNPLLTKMVMELRDGMRLYGMDSPAGRQRQVASVKEHYQMIEYGASGDVTGISDLIIEHIRTWEPVFSAALEERSRSTTIRARGR